MKRLTDEQLMLAGGETKCGSSAETTVVELTCGFAGALIGWAVTGGNPLGGVYGAKAGYGACKLACHS